MQAVDEITRTGWASLQSLESGSVGKLVTQKILGWENYGIGTSGRQNEKGMRSRSTGWTSLKPRDPGNVMTGKGDHRRSRDSWKHLHPGTRWGRDSPKMGIPLSIYHIARGTLTELNPRLLGGVEV